MKPTRTGPKNRATALGASILAAVVLSACTFVPTDDQPQTVPFKNVPFNLLGKHQSANQR